MIPMKAKILAPTESIPYMIKVSGPLYRGHGYLKFPPNQRYPFDRVLLHVQNNVASIIHAPYHSGKATFLAEIAYELEARGVEICKLWGDAIAQDINKTGNQDELYAHISARLTQRLRAL
jgi:hypothetical protein